MSVGITSDTARSRSTRSSAGGRTSARALPERQDVDDHRRLRRLQLPAPGCGTRAAAPRRHDRPAIRVCHFPPGTSKWNKIEHRMFSFVSQLARQATREPRDHRQPDRRHHDQHRPEGLRPARRRADTSEASKSPTSNSPAMNITRNTFHGDWNYTITPSHAQS